MVFVQSMMNNDEYTTPHDIKDLVLQLNSEKPKYFPKEVNINIRIISNKNEVYKQKWNLHCLHCVFSNSHWLKH
jgi:hypothetical protein